MYIKTIHISSFGPMKNRTLHLGRGLNVIEGKNESGKTSVASFIKFIFYGMSGRSVGGSLPERRRNVSWHDGRAAGYIIFETDEGEFRVERELSVSFSDSGSRRESVRETVRIFALPAMEQIHKDCCPGEVFFGVGEGIFMNTAFVRQMSGATVDGGELGEAIQNIMLSADESVSVDDAVDRLEKSRRELMHKKGTGGAVNDLIEQREALRTHMQSNMENVREILALEASLADCRRNISQRQEKKNSLAGVLAAYDAISEYKKLSDADATRADMTRIKSELDSLNVTCADHECTARLRELSEIMDRCGTAASELAGRRLALENELSSLDAAPSDSQIADDPAAVESAAAGLRRSSLSMLIAATAALGITAAAAIALMLTHMVSPATAGAIIAVGAAAAAVLSIASAGRRRSLKKLLAYWRAKHYTELRDCVSARLSAVDRAKELEAQLRYTDIAASENENTRRETAAEIVSLAGKLGLNAESVPDEYYGQSSDYSFTDEGAKAARSPIACLAEYAADVSADICRRRDMLLGEYNTVSGRLSVLDEHFEGVDRAEVLAAGRAAEKSADGAAAMALDPDGAAEARRAKDFCADTLNALGSRESIINEKLAALRAVTGSAAEDEEKIRRLTDEIERLTLRHDALCLARDTLIKAGEGLRRGVLPTIVTTAAEYLRAASRGRYSEIGVAQDLSVSFTDESVSRSIEYLSEGTKEMTYICLRMALSQVMFGDRRPPAIYDESFAGLDEDRLASMMALVSSHGQSLLFTCRRLEADIAADMDDVAVINMDD